MQELVDIVRSVPNIAKGTAPTLSARFEKMLQQMPVENPLAVGNRGAVTGTYNAPAMRAGLEALKQGGTAVDAVVTTALTHVALAAGAWVSYAGIFTMVY